MRTVEPPKIERVILDDWDPSGETWVDVREPRLTEDLRRSRTMLPNVLERVYPDGTIEREISEPSDIELAILECWLLFADSSIRTSDGQTFVAGMSEKEFYAIILTLPPELVLEWHSKAIEKYPIWR